MSTEPNHNWICLRREIDRLTYGVLAARALLQAMHGVHDMGKLSDLGSAIRSLKEAHEKEADALLVKVNSLAADAPAIFSRGHNYLDSLKADAADLERELRGLSNGIPLPE